MSKCIYTQEQHDKILEERNELANENFKLKQQLAEKDSTIKTLIEDSKASKELLKKQLAEKKKEIENIKLCRCVNCTNEYEFMLEGLVKDLEKQIDKDNQDKISFCIEWLEKVKTRIQEDFDYDDESALICIADRLTNQIKKLKEGQ